MFPRSSSCPTALWPLDLRKDGSRCLTSPLALRDRCGHSRGPSRIATAHFLFFPMVHWLAPLVTTPSASGILLLGSACACSRATLRKCVVSPCCPVAG